MRRTASRQQMGVALFPFLAVLICTMGALIVLLVLLVQQARVDAKTIAEREAAPPAGDDKAARERIEDAEWRREMLEQGRAEKTAELAAARAKLAHLEEHIGRLKDKAKALLNRARQIDEGKKLEDAELAAQRAELDKLQAEIVRKQQELDAAREKLKTQERWYALIPYEGANGTRRRPIYIECAAEGIVIQPEGILLLPDDFNGPLGPGNPLDAALRTIREHLQATTGGQLGEPYPLLVVRPGGIVAYSAARAALKSWDDEFGYELISDDKQLVFGEPDPVLARELETTIGTARKRQAAMAAMMPRQFQRDEALTTFSPDALPRLSSGGSQPSLPGAGLGPGGGLANGSGAAGASSAGGAPSAQSNPFASTAGGPGEAQGTTPGSSSGPASSATGAPQTAAPGGGTATSPGAAQFSAGGYPAGGSSGAASGSTASGSSSAGSASGSTGGASSGSASVSMQSGKTGQAGRARGTNWGLPGANLRSTAVTRPIHVVVLLDRIVIVPERGDDRQPVTLRIQKAITAADVDKFVAAVQHEMKFWGLAVANGYWKPLLQLQVAPDAEHQYEALVGALEGSGFDVERKQP